MKPRRDLDQALEEVFGLAVRGVPGELELLVRVEEAALGAELVGAVEPALEGFSRDHRSRDGQLLDEDEELAVGRPIARAPWPRPERRVRSRCPRGRDP